MTRRPFVDLLSVLSAPLLVLGSAHELFFRNQRELSGTASVLEPFWWATVTAILLGWMLARRCDRPWARTALWAYQAAGATFLIYSFLRGTGGYLMRAFDKPASLLFVAAFYLTLVITLRRCDHAASRNPLAVFGVVLAFQLAVQWTIRSVEVPGPRPRAAPRLGAAKPGLPNVYHLVLDGFQSEFFDLAWPAGKPLEGFVHVAGTRSFFGATALSMASTFMSRRPTPFAPALQTATSAEDSLLQRLRSVGYRTAGYLPGEVYPPQIAGFDAIMWHELSMPRSEAEPLHRRLFRRLWLAATLPIGIVDTPETKNVLGMGNDQDHPLRDRRISTLTQPITAVLSFAQYLEHEAALPSEGRYTLIHLLVPHGPFVLGADCGYHDIWQGTNGMEQHKCAVLVIERFLKRLDELGRLNDSVVVIQSDHGSDIRWESGAVVSTPWIPTLGDRPALFLFKPRRSQSPLRRITGTAALIDLVPTLFQSLGLPASPSWEGHALQCGAAPASPPRGEPNLLSLPAGGIAPACF